MQNVYKLEGIYDDPRFEGFGLLHSEEWDLLDFVPGPRTTPDWEKRRAGSTWRSIEVIGRVRKYNDYPGVGLLPGFSKRAVDCLRHYLEPNGELLPVLSKTGEYYAYNVTTAADVMDKSRSLVQWLPGCEPGLEIAMKVQRFELIPDRLAGLSIFFMRELSYDTFVTQCFVDRAKECGLQGFHFQKVWPLPPDVDWKKLARQELESRYREGLPAGQIVKGNTVVLRLMRRGERKKASAEERRRIEQIMDELDAILIEADSAAPPVGSLEGHEFIKGECRLFFSCPDADALVTKLRPWLAALQWEEGFRVLKRYGGYVDPEAREEYEEL